MTSPSPLVLLRSLTALLLFASIGPAAYAQHYYSGGGQVPLTTVAGRYVVEAAPGVNEAALAQALGSDFTIAEGFPRDFYVLEAASGLKATEAEALLDANASVARYHPEYDVTSGSSRFTITDRVRAEFGPGVTQPQIDALHAQYGVETVHVGTFPDGSSVHTLRVRSDSPHSTLEVANAYYLSPLTLWAVPDAYVEPTLDDAPAPSPLLAPHVLPYVLPFAGSIDDPEYLNQWHLNNTGQGGGTTGTDIDAEAAWAITTGSAAVTVAVVDTGVEAHEDFEQGQLLSNGWTIPFHLQPGNCTPPLPDGGAPIGGDVHGQNVAGLVAAAFNTKGVRGVSEHTRILPIRINYEVELGTCKSNPLSEMAAAIDTTWMRGADVMNASWGAPDSDDIAAAFSRALRLGRGGKGTVMVAAAGNNTPNSEVAFPARLDSVLAVGAVTNLNQKASYSPLVSIGRRPNVVAPSSGGTLAITTMRRYNLYTSSFGGTSAAAPQVAGIAALILAINPDLTEAEVRALIEQTADFDTGYAQSWAGHGRVNAYRALVRTLELYGGTLAQDVTVPAGETWDLGAVSVAFAPGTRLVVEGTLNADGTTFTEADAGQGWDGIDMLGAGALDLSGGATVEHAATGVAVYDGATATITGSTLRYNTVGLDVLSDEGTTVSTSVIEENGTGVRTGVPQTAPGATVTCFSVCRSTFFISDSFVNDNDDNGVYAISVDADVRRTEMSGNGQSGLRVADATVDPFNDNILDGNGNGAVGFGTSHDGISVLTGGTLRMRQLGPVPYGINRVVNSLGYELAVASGGTVLVGTSSDGGRNSIYDEIHTGALIANNSGGTLYARETFWDAATPPSGAFTGVVKWTPASDCDYTVSPPDCISSSSRTAGGAASVPSKSMSTTEDASGASAARGGGWLRAEILAVRAALAADPTGETAPRLVRILATLHRFDRDDGTGEYEASWALLRSLRARLSGEGGGLPPALRPAAEAALGAEAVERLVRGEHEEARGLVALDEAAEDGGVRRVLRLTEAHLEAAEGRYAEAAALVATVAAEEGELDPESNTEAVLLDLAAVFAERAGEGDGGARTAGGGTLARGDEAAEARSGALRDGLAVYPNPSSGVATVALTLAETADARVVVYDVLGRRVATLAEGELEAGTHRLAFDGGNLPAGVYLVRAEVGGAGRASAFTERLTVVR